MQAKRTEPKVKTLPVLLGPANSEAATGFPYRWVRDTAARLGVPFVGAFRKRAVRADLFVAALEKNSIVDDELQDEKPAIVSADPAAAVRAMLGVRRRSGQR